MKFVQLGTQIKTGCEKKKIYKNTQKVHYEVHKNHIIKSVDTVISINIVGWRRGVVVSGVRGERS